MKQNKTNKNKIYKIKKKELAVDILIYRIQKKLICINRVVVFHVYVYRLA